MKKVKLAVIGAGQRGSTYAQYARQYPHEAQIVAVVEPNEQRRLQFQQVHSLADHACFADWQSFFAQPPMADAVLICTQDRFHFQPAMQALQVGYHVLLEKPMSPDPLECIQMAAQAELHQRIFTICHVLRYTDFFSELKTLLDQGAIGQLMSIELSENVAFWHYAHSFVRGNWRNSDLSSPMLLAKSCHDLDILLWLAGSDCLNISSFGSLTHFTEQNAPEGAPLRCLDGCPVEHTCAYYAPKQYLTENTNWPTNVISDDLSLAARLKALETGPYGRCVYHCDNNVVDHQVVNLEFANQVSAVFTMTAFTQDCIRMIRLMGTKGEIQASTQNYEITVLDFQTQTRRVISLSQSEGLWGHGGGDFGLIRDFVHCLRTASTEESRTSASTSVQSHLMAFAAEQSRIEKRIVNLAQFQQTLIAKPE